MEWISVGCPACWQQQEIELDDPGEIEVELITDCEVCCRPMVLRYWRGMGGEVEAEVRSGND